MASIPGRTRTTRGLNTVQAFLRLVIFLVSLAVFFGVSTVAFFVLTSGQPRDRTTFVFYLAATAIVRLSAPVSPVRMRIASSH